MSTFIKKTPPSVNIRIFNFHLGAFSAAPKTGLCGAPRFRAPTPTFGRKRPNAVAKPLQKQIRRICDPLRGSASGKPEGVLLQRIVLLRKTPEA
jgi:hypothetical protein